MLQAGEVEACALFPILNDSLALELREEFEVTFAFVGATEENGALALNSGRALVVPDLHTATVEIEDENGMSIRMHITCLFVHVWVWEN